MHKEILRTARKVKVPRGWSYPAGAEIISDALVDVPQFDSIVLDFYGGLLKSTIPLYVMSADYNPNGIGFDLDNKWSIGVVAVPSDLKKPIQQALLADGFGRTRTWLIQPRPPVWFCSWKRLLISFNPTADVLLYEEEGAA